MKNYWFYIVFSLMAFMAIDSHAQDSFNSKDRLKKYKSDVSYEYWKSGAIKSECVIKRKYKWFYTLNHYYTKYYDINGNLVKEVHKVVQMGRRENKDKIIKEEVKEYKVDRETITPNK